MLARNRIEVPDSDLPLFINGKGEVVKNGLTGEDLRRTRDEDQLAIGERVYHTLVMEDNYDEGWQISGSEGDLIIFDLVTYGYGKDIKWGDLQDRVNSLRA